MTYKGFLRGENGLRDFAQIVGMPDQEVETREALLRQSFMPFSVTRHYADVIARADVGDKESLKNIVLPFSGDKLFQGRFDPYGNISYSQSEANFIQHKYPNTVLLHITDHCASNCQFCYKVNEIRIDKIASQATDDKIAATLAYLDGHPEVNNILFTGGDPAAIKIDHLIKYIDALISHRNIRTLRFATKAIVFDPARFLDDHLLTFFTSVNRQPGKQIAVIAQINHPAEITAPVQDAIRAFQRAGTQVRGQPTIARGVNHDVDTLVRLQRAFLDNQIIAYYLTIFMPVRGVEQYGILLHEAYHNVATSRRQLSGLEKKGVLLASHDFGKFEIVGFLPNAENPEKIVIKWHQAAKESYIPAALTSRIPHKPDDVLVLDYDERDIYCIDHLFRHNGLPHFNSDGQFIEA